MQYRHTQTTVVSILVFAIVEAVVLAAMVLAGADLVALVVLLIALGVVALVLVIASRLTVEVDDAALRVSFGNGWPRKQIQLGEVASARKVRNRWWYGFGIRKIPGGWLWNVWGLDAVELTLDTGRKFRVGTDEPDTLLAALSGLVATA